MAGETTTAKMPTSTKIGILVLFIIIAGVVIWYFTKDDKKDIAQNTTTSTKTGLSALNLTGFFSGLFGKTGGSPKIDGTMGTKPDTDSSSPRTDTPEPRA